MGFQRRSSQPRCGSSEPIKRRSALAIGFARQVSRLWVIALWATPVLARAAADAGAGRAADVPLRDKQVSASKGRAHSPFFPKLIGPALLSEKVRARLEERARSRALEQAEGHASEPESAPGLAPLADSPLAEPAGVDSVQRVMAGEGPSRRMVSFETDEGVTVLSNHARDVPTPAPAVAKRVPLGVEVEPVLVADRSHATETRGLRPRTAPARHGTAATTSASVLGTGLIWWAVAAAAIVGLALTWFVRGRGSATQSANSRRPRAE